MATPVVSDSRSNQEPFWSRSEHRAVVLTLLLALLARVAGAIFFRNQSFGDQGEYLSGAERLLAGLPLPQRNPLLFVRAPGYSLFIALVWLVTGGKSLMAVRLVQALIGTATCWYVYRLARLLTREVPARLLALAVVACYPYLIHQSAMLGTEGVFAFLVVSSSYYLISALRQNPVALRPLVMGSLLLAYANLVRPNLAITLPLAGLWILSHFWRRWRDIAVISATVLLSVLVLSLPWTLAVHRQGLGWMWITDGSAVWYWVGHQDSAMQEFRCEPTTAVELRALERDVFGEAPIYKEARKLPLDQQMGPFWKAALAWDAQNPGKQPCLALAKVKTFWRPWVSLLHYSRRDVLISLYSLPVLLFGLVGLYLDRGRGERLLWAWTLLNIAAGTLTAAIFAAEVRYRVPVVDVLLAPFFGVAVTTVARRAAALWSKRPASEPAQRD